MLFDFFNFNKQKKGVCNAPFSQIFVCMDGRVFLCPDCYMAPMAVLGNLYEKSFDEIWNSNKAINIRKQALKKLYCYCSYETCNEKSNFHSYIVPDTKIDYSSVQTKYPKMVCFGVDSECNVSCIMCRGENWHCAKEEFYDLRVKVENLYLPILKDAEYLTLSTTSDPFASRTCRLLIKKSAQMYPNLKYHLLTNGILCDEFNCQDLGIMDRLGSVMFSIHSCTKQTYDSIVKNGDFDRVCKNIELMSFLKSQDKVENFFLSFVVSSKNYKEIPDFIEFAKKNNAVALFWACRDWGGNLDWIGEDILVCDPKHEKHSELKQILNSIELETEYSHFSLQLHKIKNK